jgi:uncharacterized membrane protein
LPPTSILAVSYFFHLIATVVWIGGLILTVIVVWPELTRTLKDKPELFRIVSNLRRRLSTLNYLSLVVLVVTGLFQMTGDPNYDGVLQFDNEWSRVMLLKHLSIGGMFLCGLALQFSVTPALERLSLLLERGKGDPAEWSRLRRRELRLTWLNALLGILVLGFTAWATAL